MCAPLSLPLADFEPRGFRFAGSGALVGSRRLEVVARSRRFDQFDSRRMWAMWSFAASSVQKMGGAFF